jgi:3-methyladenine DNA glycosylase AlkD
VLPRLTRAYAAAADPQRAASAAAYMRDAFPFLGIMTPDRRKLSREVLAGTPRPDEADCTAIALRCWALPEREYRYFAVDYLRRHVARSCTSGFLPTARHLITTDSWWDTVDQLAAHVVGPLVAADPALPAVMDRWIDDADLWIVRTALLHQLAYRTATDPDIRKAIGWALRSYAYTDPDAVYAFVESARDRLSPLSVREALKHAPR